jgi:predicted MFS family arabinose efflux permease
MAGRSWTRAAMLGWMVTLLVVVAWVLFIAIGTNGPPMWIRLGVWFGCALVSASAVYWVRGARASDGRNAAA